MRFAMLVLTTFVFWTIAGAAAWWIAAKFIAERWIAAN
jgi:hypothetical protein